jgi:hypothetical protein
MADRMLFISWGTPIPGREERALDVFNEAVGLYGRMQQDGRIESFDVSLLRPNSDLDGFIEIRGTGAQIAAIQDDEDYLRTMADAQLIVHNLRTCEGYTGEGVAKMMTLFREASAKVPQMA